MNYGAGRDRLDLEPGASGIPAPPTPPLPDVSGKFLGGGWCRLQLRH